MTIHRRLHAAGDAFERSITRRPAAEAHVIYTPHETNHILKKRLYTKNFMKSYPSRFNSGLPGILSCTPDDPPGEAKCEMRIRRRHPRTSPDYSGSHGPGLHHHGGPRPPATRIAAGYELAPAVGPAACRRPGVIEIGEFDHVTRREMHVAVSGVDCPVSDPNSINTTICQLRKKLKPHGIEIVTRCKLGHRLTEDSKAKIRALLGAGIVDATAPPTGNAPPGMRKQKPHKRTTRWRGPTGRGRNAIKNASSCFIAF